MRDGGANHVGYQGCVNVKQAVIGESNQDGSLPKRCSMFVRRRTAIIFMLRCDPAVVLTCYQP